MGIQLNKLALKPNSTQSAANISAVRLNYRADQTQIYPINHGCLISACLIKGELPVRGQRSPGSQMWCCRLELYMSVI